MKKRIENTQKRIENKCLLIVVTLKEEGIQTKIVGL